MSRLELGVATDEDLQYVLTRAIIYENLEEIGEFTEEERKQYQWILKDFIDAQGTDMRNNIEIDLNPEGPSGQAQIRPDKIRR